VDELERWLASINLSHLASKLKEHNVTAEVLSLCRREEELEQCGVTAMHARLLMRQIEEVRGVGVQLTAIAPPQIPPPAPLRPHAPTPPPGNEVGLIPATSNLISNPIVLMYLCMFCTAVPRIARPSVEQFFKYAKEGKTEQVAEALLHYPDLVNVQDGGVSDLCYCDEDRFPSLCDCLLFISPLDARFITTQSSPRLQL